MKPLEKLALKQIDRRLNRLRSVMEATQVSPGWISFMRKAMCMTLDTLAKQTKLSKPNVQKMEKREREGKVTLETLEKIARAMDCELIYAFVPKQEVHKTLMDKARKKATKLIQKTDAHMVLEGQQVKQKFEDRVEHLASALFEKGDIW